MALRPEYDGDALRVPGAVLAVAQNRGTQDFIGLYALTPEGSFIRANRMWITATGKALSQLNGARIVKMDSPFIDVFDDLDATGRKPSPSQVVAGRLAPRTASP